MPIAADNWLANEPLQHLPLLILKRVFIK